MFDFLVTADGGLTTAGYAVCIIAGILLFVAVIAFAGKVSEKKRMGTKQLVFCAVTMALAFVTSYLKIFEMPWGGSVTLCSMLFIVLAANWYGPKTGVLVGLAYGILQFLQEPYVLPSSRCAAITSWHLLPWESQDSLRRVNTVW